MKGQLLPPQDYVARHCRGTDLAYGPDGAPVMVTEAAFRPKQGEMTGISVIWEHYFGGPRPYRLNCVRSACSLSVTGTHRLALVHVANASAAISNAGFTPAIVEDPCDDLPPAANAAHALLGPIDALNDVLVREAIAASVGRPDIVPYKLDL
jgi:hypothetical protein